MKGIEPSYAAWEAAVLPLNYTRKKKLIPRVSNHGPGPSRLGRWDEKEIRSLSYCQETTSSLPSKILFPVVLPGGVALPMTKSLPRDHAKTPVRGLVAVAKEL